VLDAPVPDNETARLAELYDYELLDTASEQLFDEIASSAAAICGTEYAAITLIDRDRQWFKARHGIAVEQTARDQSICGHAILQTDFFLVPDTEKDTRFAGNPLLQDLGIRFYGGTPLHGAKGNTLGMLCVLDPQPLQLTQTQQTTLTQLGRVAMVLFEAHRRRRRTEWLGSLVDQLDEEVFVFDQSTGHFLHANACALGNIGLSGLEPEGMQPHSVTPDVSASEFEAHMQLLATGANQVVFETVRQRDPAGPYPVEARWQRMQTNGRDVLVAFVRDISARQQLDKAKDEFISVVSHELRTPLTALYGAIKLVGGGACGELSSSATAMLDLASRNADSLLAIVNDILDLEKCVAGLMEFEIGPVAVEPLLEDLARSQGATAQAAGVTIHVASPEFLQVLADARRLQQVLANLLSNALKFAPKGSTVHLQAQMRMGRVELSVTDQGPGVPEAFQERIFQRFAQADMQTTRTKGGSGLGLSIVKAMVEEMNGQVGFESVPGRTCFHVVMPESKLEGA
jgi:PAS domain S-box-containing protein